jgi:hypothetical protein
MMLLCGPEAGWRTRTLVRSVQEADTDLWRKLYEAEQLVLAMRNDADHNCGTGMTTAHDNPRVRQAVVQEAQSRFLELHRHFKHLHKTLLSTLEAHEQAQRATVAQQLHTAAVLMRNPATAIATGAGSVAGPSPHALLKATPMRSHLLLNGPGNGGVDLTT